MICDQCHAPITTTRAWTVETFTFCDRWCAADHAEDAIAFDDARAHCDRIDDDAQAWRDQPDPADFPDTY